MIKSNQIGAEKTEIINNIKFSLFEMAFLDIKRASEGKSKMGAFILSSCFIEYITGFRYGKETNGKDYKRFVAKYLTSYDAEKLYKDLRCKLVHNYSEGGSYMFTDNKAEFHLKKTTSNKLMLNLENFIDDIENALKTYFDELEKDVNIYELALLRLKKIGILGISPVTVLHH